MKEIFDEISLAAIKFLERHEGVSNVQFYEIGPIANVDHIAQWSQKNAPFELPSDFQSFICISDGLLLKWSIYQWPQQPDDKAADNTIGQQNISTPLGNMRINSLQDVVLIPDPEFVAFALDSGVSQNDGKVAFVFDTSKSGSREPRYYSKNQPQIWFQDLACEWHFIAHNFTDYFRLMIMHLGVRINKTASQD